MPTAFTPNGDGTNDIFYAKGFGIKKLVSFKIFNRLGQLLFVSTDENVGWDGTYKGEMSKQDVYTYLVNFQAIDGKKHTKTGHVTLLK